MKKLYPGCFFIAFSFLMLLGGALSSRAQQLKPIAKPFARGTNPTTPGMLNDGTDFMLERLRSNPAYLRAENKMNQEILSAISNNSILAADYVLPVVFHIISADPAAVTDQQMLDALTDLNQAFSKSGVYAGGDNALTPGVDTRIQFCLAKNDPDGGNTSGITRTKSYFNDFDVDIEDGRMKNLTLWDPARYVNIWYVTRLRSELMPTFRCGIWSRLHEGGYATMPPGGGITDGIVVTGFGALLAHEMGHYLGLYHTFEGLNCVNTNCAVDGDRVCDTPPDASIGNSVACDQPDNSCRTDTVSGFAVNAPDMISNFMDYGNDNCHKSFTDGQGQRMRAAIATQRSSLLQQNQCDQPCAENAVAAFTRDIAYPLPGNTLSFTNSSSAATNFEWIIDGVTVATSANLTYQFASTGKYKVSLKAFNGDPSCFAMYTDYIIVNCGVVARFYPDKRIIASKANIYSDSLYFTNRSENASSYRWLMSNDQGMAEQQVSSSANLNFTFLVPGKYTVRLIASNGSCIDTTETFRFTVQDPTADVQLSLQSAVCYQQDKIQLSFTICNGGFASLPSGMPVSFYDNDPRVAGAHKLGMFTIPTAVSGKCCSARYTYVLDIGHPGLSTIYIVANDNGTTLPLSLPNTSLVETNYANNIVSKTQFGFTVGIVPATATMIPGDSLQLSSTAGPDLISYSWTPARDLTCTDCANPILVAVADTVAKLVATSQYGCIDSAYSVISVPAADDYTISLNSIACASNNRLFGTFTICNSFRRGKIPKGLKVSFYDADPAGGSAHLLSPVFVTPADSNQLCASFSHYFAQSAPGKVYAVVNDNGTTKPLSFPNTAVTEKDFTNNISSNTHSGFTATVAPPAATLEPGDSLQLISTAGPNAISYSWTPARDLSCTTCSNPVLVATTDTVARLVATSQYGCTDTAYSVIRVPAADDYTITLNSLSCAGNNRLFGSFTVCNSFRRGKIPKGLKVSFYDADPSSETAHLLSPVFVTPADSNQLCASFTHYFTQAVPGKIYAVVNDNGTTVPLSLPNTPVTEKNYGNNKASNNYVQPVATLEPADTTVIRKQQFVLRLSTNQDQLAGYEWTTDPAYTLSCKNCSSPMITALDNATIRMQVKTTYGCLLPASANVKIFKPDFTIELLGTSCYTNETTEVSFKINVGNGYDSIVSNLPVAFYDASPATRNPQPLLPKFVTRQSTAGSSAIFKHVIRTPLTRTIYAVVNDKSEGISAPPEILFPESDYNNNVAIKNSIPFTLQIVPGDTGIQRSTPIQLRGEVAGGTASIILWETSAPGLISCTHCLNPIATPDASATYQLTIQNENSCTATAFATVKTYTSRKMNIPSAFTPNGDGRNDVFYIMAGKDVRIVKNLSVFNRWGEKVFETLNSAANDRNFGWNGTINGRPAIPGTYVYVTNVEFADGSREVFKGTITLIR